MDMTAYFLGRAANGGGGSSVQSDYLQNDSSAKDYIKNRPFYSEITFDKEIIPLQEIEFEEETEELKHGYVEVEKNLPLVVGEKYLFSLDEENTEIVLIEGPRNGTFLFGNLSFLEMGEDTGEPYVGGISYLSEDSISVNVSLKTTEEKHTLALSYLDNVAPIVTKGVYSFSPVEDNSKIRAFSAKMYSSFQSNGIYNIYLNHNSYLNYQPIAVTVPDEEPIICIGNASLINSDLEDTGEDFLIIPPMDGELWILTTLPEGEYEFEFNKNLLVEKIYKIDSKYIPVPYTVLEDGTILFKDNIIFETDKNLHSLWERFSTSEQEILELKTSNSKLITDTEGLQENILENTETLTEIENITNNLPRPLLEGFIYENEDKDTSGLSAGQGNPSGVYAWVEGTSGQHQVNIAPNEYAESPLLIVITKTGDKSSVTDTYLRYTCVTTSDAPSIEAHLQKLEKCDYLLIIFSNNEQQYYLKREEVRVVGNDIRIDYSFLPGHPTFTPTASMNGTPIDTIIGIGSLGNYSHSEGEGTIAKGKAQHTQGKYNIIDEENKYSHIIGNGNSDTERSNAHTVDWDGNAWYAGSVTAKNFLDENGNPIGGSTDIEILESVNATENHTDKQVYNAPAIDDTLLELVEALEEKQDALNVSGATAGQIIKISEVHDGKPTAWEPVDFPSTEEEWEHICDIPVVEDTENPLFKITQSLGADYKKLHIVVNKNSAGGLVATGCDSYPLRIFGNSQHNNNLIAQFGGGVTSTGWSFYSCEIDYNKYTNLITGWSSICPTSHWKTINAALRKPIHTLIFVNDAQSDATKGFRTFTINVWGVRA